MVVGNVVYIYLDRLVEYVCEELMNMVLSDDFDVETFSRGYRAFFVRVWCFVIFMDMCVLLYVCDVLIKI